VGFRRLSGTPQPRRRGGSEGWQRLDTVDLSDVSAGNGRQALYPRAGGGEPSLISTAAPERVRKSDKNGCYHIIPILMPINGYHQPAKYAKSQKFPILPGAPNSHSETLATPLRIPSTCCQSTAIWNTRHDFSQVSSPVGMKSDRSRHLRKHRHSRHFVDTPVRD